MPKVFISHSWKDNELSRKIAHQLKEDGAEIWIDYARIKPGEGMPDRIGEALEWCDTFVLVWSQHAVDSYYVKLEWQSALDMKKRIIPCIIDGTKRPPILRGFLYIDFKNFVQGYKQLLDALNLILTKKSEPPIILLSKVETGKVEEKKKFEALNHKDIMNPKVPINPTPKIVTGKAEEEKKLDELDLKYFKKPELPIVPSSIVETDNLEEKKSEKQLVLPYIIMILFVFGIYILLNIDWDNPKSDNLNVVNKEKIIQDSIKFVWEQKQIRMNLSYQQVKQKELDDRFTAKEKKLNWQQFLKDYADDNSYYTQDNNQRFEAISRLNYWRNQVREDSIKNFEKESWDQIQLEMNNSYQQVLRNDDNTKLSTKIKEQEWQNFLDKYAADNPFTEKDDEQRLNANSQKNYWRNYKSHVIQQNIITPKKIILPGSSIGIQWVHISGDTFKMGDNFGVGCINEKPVHKVTISDFYMSITEVTVGQFSRFVEATNYCTMAEKEGWMWVWSGTRWTRVNGITWRNPYLAPNENYPVVAISWYDANEFCKWVRCRLPTEAEWEYAARELGKEIKWSGTNIENLLGEYAWYNENSSRQTHPVGIKKPNALGLYDMSGNVWEWCGDWYGEKYYYNCNAQGIVKDPVGPATGNYRVMRGGSWDNYAKYCRVGFRDYGFPAARYDLIGFRLVFVP